MQRPPVTAENRNDLIRIQITLPRYWVEVLEMFPYGKSKVIKLALSEASETLLRVHRNEKRYEGEDFAKLFL